jgi:hypothetical protein
VAGGLYDKGRERFLGPASGQINWINDTIKAVLVSSSYAPNLTTHEFASSIQTHTGSVTPQTLATKTATNGVADADDVTFTTLAVDFVVDYVVLFKDSGAINTSPLICAISGAIGIPLTGSGGDITVQWNNGSNKIFKL